MKLVVVVVAAVVLVGAAAATAASPAQLYRQSLAAARAQRSVHYVSQAHAADRSIRIVGDAARDRGSQRITVTRSGKTGHVVVLVIANTAYLKGDVFTLQSYMGFPSSQATKFAGKWLRIRHGSQGFTAVAAAVRLDSAVSELAMRAPLGDGGTETIDGVRTVGIASAYTRAGVRVKETLYVRASGTPLPVSEVTAAGSHGTLTVALQRWNMPVRVSAPKTSVLVP
jgi:hypothetical protein